MKKSFLLSFRSTCTNQTGWTIKSAFLRFQLAPGNRLSLPGNFINGTRIVHYPFLWSMTADVFRNSECFQTSFWKTRFRRRPTLFGPNNVVSADRTRNPSCAPPPHAPATACISPYITLRNATRLQYTF